VISRILGFSSLQSRRALEEGWVPEPGPCDWCGIRPEDPGAFLQRSAQRDCCPACGFSLDERRTASIESEVPEGWRCECALRMVAPRGADLGERVEGDCPEW
jgi:hypothetical protein